MGRVITCSTSCQPQACDSMDLAKQLFYTCIVGYQLRCLEVRLCVHSLVTLMAALSVGA